MKALIKAAMARLGFQISRIPGRNSKASNFDEEEVIGRWISELSIDNRYCVDIGASDGVVMSNSFALFNRGWSGVAVESGPAQFVGLARNYVEFPKVSLARGKVSPGNVAAILAWAGAPRAFGFLTLDIDSYDYFVLEQLLKHYRPSLVCTEVNLHFPPPLKFTVRFDPALEWTGGYFYGQSLSQLHQLCLGAGYSIVELHYNNAFIVPNELCAGRALDPAEAYRRGFVDKPDRRERIPWSSDEGRIAGLDPQLRLEQLRAELKTHEGRFDLSL